jgi:hypothetical protein
MDKTRKYDITYFKWQLSGLNYIALEKKKVIIVKNVGLYI